MRESCSNATLFYNIVYLLLKRSAGIAPRTMPPDRRFAPASVSRPSAPVPGKKYEGKTGIGLNDYFCIGTNRRKHEKTLDRLHRITYRRPDRIPLHPLLLRLRRGRQKRRVELCRL